MVRTQGSRLYFPRTLASQALIIIIISCLLSAIIKYEAQYQFCRFCILPSTVSIRTLEIFDNLFTKKKQTNDHTITFLLGIFLVNICAELVIHNIMHHSSYPTSYKFLYFLSSSVNIIEWFIKI